MSSRPIINGFYPTTEVSGSSGATWGSITGTLSSQSDLQAVLDDKSPQVGATTFRDYDDFLDKAIDTTFKFATTSGVSLVTGNDGVNGVVRLDNTSIATARLDKGSEPRYFGKDLHLRWRAKITPASGNWSNIAAAQMALQFDVNNRFLLYVPATSNLTLRGTVAGVNVINDVIVQTGIVSGQWYDYELIVTENGDRVIFNLDGVNKFDQSSIGFGTTNGLHWALTLTRSAAASNLMDLDFVDVFGTR